MTPTTIHIRYGEKVLATSGEPLIIIIHPPMCVVDAHCHIQNGSCAPLPLVWNQMPGKLHLDRGMVNFLVSLAKKEASEVQIKSTSEIGNSIINEMKNTFGKEGSLAKSDIYKHGDLFTIQILQMMDMEYACIDGFKGETIYREDPKKDHWYFYEKESAFEKGKMAIVPKENHQTFSCWKKQVEETEKAIRKNNLNLLGMYHYEPRRWNKPSATTFDDKLITGGWDKPFDKIATTYKKGYFIGFKLYPPLGYKPLDERLPYLHNPSLDGDCFYARCEREGIPLLAHCSPGGMSTYDANLYMELDGWVKEHHSGDPVIKAMEKHNYSEDRYFWTNYVHPNGWREVLVRFPKLKLCLAHFGGNEWENGLSSDWIQGILALTREFKHVYTDVSCWNLPEYRDDFIALLTDPENKHIVDKLLFGTDWFLMLIALNKKNHKQFCEEFFDCIMSLPNGAAMWEKFTFINPFAFYGLHDLEMIRNVAETCMEQDGDDDTIITNLKMYQFFYTKYRKIITAGEPDGLENAA